MSRPTARESVALMAGYHSPQIDVDVRLNTNESPEPPPEGFTDAVTARVAEIAWHRYPQRSASELRSRIGANYGLSASQVFAANGSNEVLQTLLLTFAGPGRSAAVFEPTYALHSHLSRITGTAVIEGERNDDFSLDLDEVERVIVEHRPDVVFLCSPNNPTGVVDPEASIRRVLELTAANGGLLCVDEAYGQFADFSAVTLLGDDTFNDCIWLTYNLPPLHLVDYDRFVKAWKKDGTQRMGIFKGAEAEAAGPDDPNSASQVVRRHLSATSPSPLYQLKKTMHTV